VVIGAAAALLLLMALAIGAHLLSRAVERRTANLQSAAIAGNRPGSAASRGSTPAAPEPRFTPAAANPLARPPAAATSPSLSAPAATQPPVRSPATATSPSSAPDAAADAQLAQRLSAEEKRVAQARERLAEQEKRLSDKKLADKQEATKSAAATPPQPAQPDQSIYFRAPLRAPSDRLATAAPTAAGRSAAAAPASPAWKPSTEGDARLASPPATASAPDAGAAAENGAGANDPGMPAATPPGPGAARMATSAPASPDAGSADSPPSPIEVAPPPGGDRTGLPGAAPATVRDLSGRWEITNVVHSTSYPTYRGLRLTYHLSLRQEGNRVVGEGEKWAENGQPIPASGRSPIQVTGEVVGREVRLHFTERGSRRSSDGNFHWRLAPGGQALDGNFISTAASSSGSSSAVRVQ
jgi:hypothetical protein